MRFAGALAALAITVLAMTGCGAEEGVAAGAVVAVYADMPLCAEAKRELAREDGQAGNVRVRVICLADQRRGKKLSLAVIGANARRATEDSTAVGYLSEADPTAIRFSQPILEEAGIAQLSGMSGASAMQKLLSALGQVDTSSGSLRESVRDELQ